jgi:Chaperone of endosialidase
LNQAEGTFPAGWFASSGSGNSESTQRGKRKERTVNPLIQFKTTPRLLIILTLLCFGLLPKAEAVVPPPDGGYPGGNTAEGQAALLSLTTGGFNTAVGFLSLRSNTTGSFNTATGAGALLANTADSNTATGTGALFSNTTGSNNTANGTFALFSNTEGSSNTASGDQALFLNTSGAANSAFGVSALARNTTGLQNTANGTSALSNNAEGANNTAVGRAALVSNVTGHDNTGLGHLAGQSITGSGNVCIGASVNGVGGANDSTWIRNVNTLTQNFSAGVNDYVTVRLSDGRLGHTAVVSSQRYKEEIKPLGAISQVLYALKPVSFRLKKEFDPTQTLGFGLIAEEVEKVDPAFVYRNAKGQVESVRYEMINAMLLNEFLKEYRTVQELKTTIARLQKQIDALTVGLQKVSAQLELNKPAPQTVLNNQ